MAVPSTMPDALAEVGRRLDERLRRETFPQAVCPDYLAAAMVAYPASGGKRLRPALLLWSCGAAGGNPERAWQAALAVELYHNWTLIHDDIIDGDLRRRGQPTCHVRLAEAGAALPGGAPERRAAFGINQAILAGDLLHAWSVDALLRSVEDGADVRVVAALAGRLCSWLTPALIGGEALDVEFELRRRPPAAELRRMMALKTGALLRFAAEAGVMLGRDCANPADPLVRSAGDFAESCGVAFQIRDDILGVFGDAERLGKPVGADLREGKNTLLVGRAFELAEAAAGRRLAELFGRRSATDGEVAEAARLIDACGARAAVEHEADGLLGQAAAALAALPDNHYRNWLAEWMDYVTRRNH